MTDLGMIEAFKESNIIRHSQNLQSGIQVFKYCGPLIETFRGDEKGAIEAFRSDDTESFPPGCL